ncbi:hypothetical protein [Methyloglobulus sp.]|uniref:hypothetical protein n=1 Tax=Methyloglobulus sp. TaxID=2518622 RepID=UPI0032B787FF
MKAGQKRHRAKAATAPYKDLRNKTACWKSRLKDEKPKQEGRSERKQDKGKRGRQFY